MRRLSLLISLYLVVLSLQAQADRTVGLFTFEEGSKMEGFTASARRLGLFLEDDHATDLSEDGISLMRAAICWTGKCAETPEPIINLPSNDICLTNPGVIPILFPNPTSSNRVSISMPNNVEISPIRITIYNSIGQSMLTVKKSWQSEFEVNTISLSPSTYYMEIETKHHIWHQKMVKTKQ